MFVSLPKTCGRMDNYQKMWASTPKTIAPINSLWRPSVAHICGDKKQKSTFHLYNKRVDIPSVQQSNFMKKKQIKPVLLEYDRAQHIFCIGKPFFRLQSCNLQPLHCPATNIQPCRCQQPLPREQNSLFRKRLGKQLGKRLVRANEKMKRVTSSCCKKVGKMN